MTMRRMHLVVGIAAAVAFLLTGQYMDRRLAHLEGMADLPRRAALRAWGRR
jgi:hypothetical protein